MFRCSKILSGKSPKAKGSLARSTSSVGLATLASRILGLVRDIVIAGFYGAGLHTDAFFVAFKIPNLLRRLVAEGALASAFVPVFTDQQELGDQEANSAIRASCGFTLLLTTSLTLVGIIFADRITALFAPGFVIGSDKFDLASELMRMMFPYIVMVSLLSLASAVLNVLGYFALPAFAPAILNISLILFALVFSGYGIVSLAWGVLAGGLLALAPQILLLKKIGYSFLPASPFGSDVVAKLCRLMAPAVLSASVYQFIVFINTLLASFLTEGSISWLYYADRLFQFPLGVFSIALATALLPALARSISKGDLEEAQNLFNNALAWVGFITVPAAFGLALLSDQLVNLIYSRGSFDQVSVENTASALVAYSLGLWAVSVQTLIIRMYLARKNTIIPALVSVFSLCWNLLLALSLMGPIPPQESAGLTNSLVSIQSILPTFNYGHDGLALAGSLTAFLTVILLSFLLPQIGSSIQFSIQSIKLFKAIASSLAMTLAIYLIGSLQLPLLFEVILSVIVGAFVYGLSSIAIRSEEALLLKAQIKTRWAK
jgi:putative peptidoglycan lipid II flippase